MLRGGGRRGTCCQPLACDGRAPGLAASAPHDGSHLALESVPELALALLLSPGPVGT